MKPTILVIAAVYAPGFLAGGPVRSISGLVEHLGGDFHWKVITTNRDFGSSTPYPDIPADSWVRKGNADVWYASEGKNHVTDVIRLIRNTPHNLLYLNSFFSPRFSIAAVLARWVGLLMRGPVLIAPRGEFSSGALQIRATKKTAYLSLARAIGALDDVWWHVSSEHEQMDVVRRVGEESQQRISVAKNLSVSPILVEAKVRGISDPLRVCFLSRICRMKNLDYALRVLALTSQPVRFSIFGPREDPAYWAECAALISDLPPHVEVIVHGAVDTAEVPAVLAGQDMLFLPTRGENYGHVLVEAWSAGLPVLTSNQTPWRGLEAAGVGWDLELGESSLSAFAEKIDLLAQLNVAELGRVSEKSLDYALAIHNDQAAVECNKNMFMSAIRGEHIGVQ